MAFLLFQIMYLLQRFILMKPAALTNGVIAPHQFELLLPLIQVQTYHHQNGKPLILHFYYPKPHLPSYGRMVYMVYLTRLYFNHWHLAIEFILPGYNLLASLGLICQFKEKNARAIKNNFPKDVLCGFYWLFQV